MNALTHTAPCYDMPLSPLHLKHTDTDACFELLYMCTWVSGLSLDSESNWHKTLCSQRLFMTQTQSITKEKTMLPLNRLFDVSTQQISYNLLSIVYKSITVKYRVSLFFFCIARQSNCLCQSVLLSVSCVEELFTPTPLLVLSRRYI